MDNQASSANVTAVDIAPTRRRRHGYAGLDADFRCRCRYAEFHGCRQAARPVEGVGLQARRRTRGTAGRAPHQSHHPQRAGHRDRSRLLRARARPDRRVRIARGGDQGRVGSAPWAPSHHRSADARRNGVDRDAQRISRALSEPRRRGVPGRPPRRSHQRRLRSRDPRHHSAGQHPDRA